MQRNSHDTLEGRHRRCWRPRSHWPTHQARYPRSLLCAVRTSHPLKCAGIWPLVSLKSLGFLLSRICQVTVLQTLSCLLPRLVFAPPSCTMKSHGLRIADHAQVVLRLWLNAAQRQRMLNPLIEWDRLCLSNRYSAKSLTCLPLLALWTFNYFAHRFKGNLEMIKKEDSRSKHQNH